MADERPPTREQCIAEAAAALNRVRQQMAAKAVPDSPGETPNSGLRSGYQQTSQTGEPDMTDPDDAL